MLHRSPAVRAQEPATSRARKEQPQARSVNYSRRLPHNPAPALPSPPSCSQPWPHRDRTPPPLGRDSTSTLPSSDSESSIFSNFDDGDDINWDLTSSYSGAPRLQMRRTSSSCSKYRSDSSKHSNIWSGHHVAVPTYTSKHNAELAEGRLVERVPTTKPSTKRAHRHSQSPPPPPPPPKDVPSSKQTNKPPPRGRPATCRGGAVPPTSYSFSTPPVPTCKAHHHQQKELQREQRVNAPLTFAIRQHVSPLLTPRKAETSKLQTSSPTLHEPAAIQKPRRAPRPPPAKPVRDHLADYDPDLGMVPRSFWDESDDEDDGRSMGAELARGVLGRVRAMANTARASSSGGSSSTATTRAGSHSGSSGKSTALPSRTSSRAESRVQSRAPSRASSRPPSESAPPPPPRSGRHILPIAAPPTSYVAPRLTRDKRSGSSASDQSTASSSSSSSSSNLLRRAVYRVAGSR